jgi:hypothetical protein
MPTLWNPAASSPSRNLKTRPSIMSDGANQLLLLHDGHFTNASDVASFATSPFL